MNYSLRRYCLSLALAKRCFVCCCCCPSVRVCACVFFHGFSSRHTHTHSDWSWSWNWLSFWMAWIWLWLRIQNISPLLCQIILALDAFVPQKHPNAVHGPRSLPHFTASLSLSRETLQKSRLASRKGIYPSLFHA